MFDEDAAWYHRSMKTRPIMKISILCLVAILIIGGSIFALQSGLFLSSSDRIKNDVKTWKTIRTVEPRLLSYLLPSAWMDDIGSSTEGMVNRSGRGMIDPKWMPSWKRASLAAAKNQSVELAPIHFDVSIRNSNIPAPTTPYPQSDAWDVKAFQTAQGLSGEFKSRSPFGVSDARLFRASIFNAEKDVIVEFIGTLPQYTGNEKDDVAVLSILQILKTVEF